MQAAQPIVKDLVLVGGGHSHAIALKQFGMKPLPGLRITLISETSDTPYSGMLPGHVAGFYSHDECHIDLRALAQFAQAQFYVDRVIGLDLENRRLICANRPDVQFDLLSINTGSTPKALAVPGALDYSLPIKPVPRFLAAWQQLVAAVAEAPEIPRSLAVVGGGAGGVELTLAVQAHLQQLLQAAGQPSTNLQIHLFQRSADLLPTYAPWVSRRFHQILQQRGVQVHLQETVCEVQPQQVICESGLMVKFDHLFWVTRASAPAWLRESGLVTDAEGFVQVNSYLQSSHPQVFAAGDVAALVQARPKAGVFAVRQGKPLYENLRRTLLGQPLKPYYPQARSLALIGTGDRSAVALRGAWGAESRLLWRWKDHIDRQFMQRFSNLPVMTQRLEPSAIAEASQAEPAQSSMRCAGCGSKVSSSVLARVLRRIQSQQLGWSERDDILIGLEAPDDAAVVQVPAGQVMLHTLDHFRSLINDPFVFGQITANHCLSDLFAMGATPQSALAMVTIPYAEEAKVEETLYQLLSGVLKVLAQAQTPLVGGHTSEGAELSLGLSCNGLAEPQHLLRKGGLQPGQALILTKPLGTGTLFAAQMRLQAKGAWIDAAVQSMLQSNQSAVSALRQHQATACTDVTGFGFLGHLLEMVRASDQVAVDLDLEAIPALPGACETLRLGIVSSLQPQNLQASHQIQNQNAAEWLQHSHYPLLFDPQTSGGLLAAVPASQATACVARLRELGYAHSEIIGWVQPQQGTSLPISLRSCHKR
ncbi:selenide, water dikinase SelD [Leptolyngbya sp. FACHB-261]|uniref:selenide, water dikinase SelD n=1 Tax=Leptolyngbya sp. FACHB-261 TaxID=2692806 RepID=UPI001683C53E|nr:selenide, water dikinase SelD [Leptolyngbya sp. FACHB-261]MBD2102101.1 selenide, water dikinase SelD [Leptolyngbya sp. FACHB-261]